MEENLLMANLKTIPEQDGQDDFFDPVILSDKHWFIRLPTTASDKHEEVLSTEIYTALFTQFEWERERERSDTTGFRGQEHR